MVPHIVESIDRRGFEYARMIAADIGKIVRNENPKPTQEDFTSLEPIVKKIASTDCVADAQVTSDDFSGCDVER